MKDKFTSGLMEEVVVLMESESVKNRITEIKHKSESIYLELIKDREVKLARGFERLLQDAKNRFPKSLIDNISLDARFASGYQIGINSKVASIAQKRKKYNDEDITDFVSFLPCDINTYISHKHPFM